MTNRSSESSCNKLHLNNARHKTPLSSLRVIQINLMHKKNSSDLLMKEISDRNVDIVLIQEPYHSKKRKSIPSVPKGYEVYTGANDDETPLAAVIIKETIPHFPLTSFSSEIFIPIEVNLKTCKITFASLYCRRNEDPIPPCFTQFIELYCLHQPNLVLGADTNAHCSSVGYERSDARGARWDDLVAENSWIIHNTPYVPTFRNSRGHQSTIDLTITNNTLFEDILSWTTESFTALSDHLPIEFKIHQSIDLEPRLVRNLKKVNWTEVNDSLSKELEDLEDFLPNTTHSIDQLVTRLEDKIKYVMNEHIPLVPLIQRKNKWWTSELEIMRKEIKRKRRRREDISKLMADYDAAISLAKNKAWQKFIGETSDSNDALLRYKILCKNKAGRKLNPVRRLNAEDGFTQSEAETARLLLSVQNPEIEDDFLQIHNEISTRVRDFKQQPKETEVPPILESEIIDAFNSIKIKKSAGPDNIPQPSLSNVNLRSCRY